MGVVMNAKGGKEPAWKAAASISAQSDGSVKAGRSGQSARSDSIVTARVPVEIKEQGNAVLKKIGATPTELVNAAYQYVLEHGELPAGRSLPADLAGKRRILTEERKRLIQDRVRRTTFAVPASYWQGKTDDQLLGEALREKYEAFA